MDPMTINYLAQEKIREFRGERQRVEMPAYAFQPSLRKVLAANFYRLASALEPRTFPPRKLA